MNYIFPVILALIIHLGIGFSFIVHQFSDPKQSRAMPRHIQAQMYNIKELATSTQKKLTSARDTELAEKKTEPEVSKPEPKTPAPVSPIAPKADPAKDQQLELEKLEKAREEQKKKKAQEREKAQQALKKELDAKKDAATKQREIESKRKIAAQEKVKKAQALKDKKRKEQQQKQKQAAQDAKKKAAAQQKKNAQAAAKKKQLAEKRQADERARMKALQQQIADEERFAAEQVANEMASGIQGYIKRMLKGNFRIPSSARNGIKAMVRIKLLASGRVVGVEIIETSGNAAFDKAAEQAVWRTERFPKVADIARASPSFFNRELRTFVISFNPKDLRW